MADQDVAPEPRISRRVWLAGLVSGASLIAAACTTASQQVLDTPEGRVMQLESDDLLVLVSGVNPVYHQGDTVRLNILVNNQAAGYMQVRLRTKLLGRGDQPVVQAEPVLVNVKSDDAVSVDQELPLGRDLLPGEYTLAVEVPPWKLDGRDYGRGGTLRAPVRVEIRRVELNAVRWLILLGVLGTLLRPVPATAHAAAAEFPMTIVGDDGVSTTFDRPPRRIVSLNPGMTEILFAVGASDTVVGVDSFSTYPAAAAEVQPRLATYPSPSVETIVSLAPDVVLSVAERDDVLNQLRAQGVPVLKLLPRDYDATAQTVETLGRLVGADEPAVAIAADMRARRDAVVAAVAGAPRPRVYEELDASDPARPFVAAPHGFYGELLELAGGTNIFADLAGDVGQVDSESIVARDPEIIVLTDADLPFNPQTPEMVAARPGWSVVSAVQNGAVQAVPGALVSTPGPRLADGLEALARIIHPEVFPSAPAAAMLAAAR